ncbi:MAG: sterol desaturase family protein [Chitinophagaceae bacterium]|nr:sterol desaturase family protein [Chitinophagaceae bacterium]
MNFYYFMRHRFNHYCSQFYCFCVYCLPAAALFLLGYMLKENASYISQFILFFWGWLTWTFTEYIAHRFWMHPKHKRGSKKDFGNHMHHHSHPTEIKITAGQRMIMLALLFALISASLWMNNYFMLLTGFYSGFVNYTFMHIILHKKWSAKIFKRLHQYHIYHHCKYPNRCFGICVTWWDMVFDTTPPTGAKLSERITAFYFGDKENKVAVMNYKHTA